ncbi:hypothetical protein HELRODRAFT_166479 [Helobdella robusta]|uniref:VWFA domain-containing protein n=1 Tax=Helobdella robusta TaxID=6412 RepID=T1EY63_HELRO|nr:hypothetical protein HELRODRAFT_166479 [Helobdella robusta]ESO11485.1 hypothetical protein HELRODRAFT_166479 [Helobdella robusta]
MVAPIAPRSSSSSAPKPCLKRRVCTVQIDLVFIFDISGSVIDEYRKSVSFARHITSGLDIDSDLVRVASVAFSVNVLSYFLLSRFRGDKEASLKAFDFTNAGGQTNIRSAMEFTASTLFVQSNGDRPGVPNVVILITDGYANVNELEPGQGADLLKRHKSIQQFNTK